MFGETRTFSGYSVDDISAARDFYEGVLGIIVEQDVMGLQLILKEQRVYIYEKQDHQPATFTVLNFVTDNITTAVSALTATGIDMERYDTLPAKQDSQGILRGLSAGIGPDIAWFKDPAGNVLAVLQES